MSTLARLEHVEAASSPRQRTIPAERIASGLAASIGGDDRISVGRRAELCLRLLILVFLGFECLWGLQNTPLTETDEGFAANRAESFYRHGSAVLSYDDVDSDAPQFRKPPLLYWCVAALYSVLGTSLYAIRLPTALASLFLFLTLASLVERYLGKWCALWSAVLPVTIPFILLHVRTAMLDLPLLLLVFVCFRVFCDPAARASRGLLAGVVAGAALLLKGAAGFAALCTPILFVLVTQGPSRRWLRNSLLCGLAALGCVTALVLALPPAYRAPWLAGIFWHESVGRLVREYSVVDRVHYLGAPLLQDLRWHVLAALLALPLLAREAVRDRRVREWILLALVVSAPFVIGGLKLPASFSRYFLVVDLLVLTSTPFFALHVLGGPAATLLLLPFAALSFQLEASGWRWVPALSALGVLLVANLPPVRNRGSSRYALATVLVASIAVPSHFSEAAAVHSIGMQHAFPEVIPLAKHAGEVVPPNERLVIGWGFSSHAVLWYSRRSLETFHHWLLSSFEPGGVRYAIFHNAREPEGIPGLEATLVRSAPPWALVRLRVSPEVESGTAIFMKRPWDDMARVDQTLQLLGVEFRRFSKGFVLSRPPDRNETLVAADELFVAAPDSERVGGSEASLPLVIRKGQDLVVRLSHQESCSGLELTPASKAEDLSGVRIEGYDPHTQSWLELKAVDRPVDPTLRLTAGRIEQVPVWALRVRFDPLVTSKLRILRTVETPLHVHSVSLYVASGSAELREPG